MLNTNTIGGLMVNYKERIKTAKQKNLDESNTKSYLIEPFLKSIGIDVNDIEQTVKEYKITSYDKNDAVDYAIIHNNKPVLIIEAKRIGQNINNHIGQLRRYFNSSALIKYALITNGEEYLLFTDTVSENIMDSQPILRFNISQEENFIIHYDDLTMLKEKILEKQKQEQDLTYVFENESKLLEIIKDSIHNHLPFECSPIIETHLINKFKANKNTRTLLDKNVFLEGYKIKKYSIYGMEYEYINIKLFLLQLIEYVDDLSEIIRASQRLNKKIISNNPFDLSIKHQNDLFFYKGYFIDINYSDHALLSLSRRILKSKNISLNGIVFTLEPFYETKETA